MPRAARPSRRDPTDLAGLRVALYCRVSQDRYRTEKSVDDQEAEGRRWVSEHGAVLAGLYADDDRSASRYARRPGSTSTGWSGTSRPGSWTRSGSGSCPGSSGT
jgi:hypothetical protein